MGWSHSTAPVAMPSSPTYSFFQPRRKAAGRACLKEMGHVHFIFPRCWQVTVEVWKCVAQQKYTGHNTQWWMITRGEIHYVGALDSQHLNKCYSNKMEGPRSSLPNADPTAAACHHTISIAVALWGSEPKGRRSQLSYTHEKGGGVHW